MKDAEGEGGRDQGQRVAKRFEQGRAMGRRRRRRGRILVERRGAGWRGALNIWADLKAWARRSVVVRRWQVLHRAEDDGGWRWGG